MAAKKKDNVYWVVSERRFLTWDPIEVYSTEEKASIRVYDLISTSTDMSLIGKYKVSRVELKG